MLASALKLASRRGSLRDTFGYTASMQDGDVRDAKLCTKRKQAWSARTLERENGSSDPVRPSIHPGRDRLSNFGDLEFVLEFVLEFDLDFDLEFPGIPWNLPTNSPSIA